MSHIVPQNLLGNPGGDYVRDQVFAKRQPSGLLDAGGQSLGQIQALLPHVRRQEVVQAGSNVTITYNALGPVIAATSGGSTPTGTGFRHVTSGVEDGATVGELGTTGSVVRSATPSAGQLLVGNAGGTAYAPVTASGDVTVASTGAHTIANSAVTLAKIANASANSKLLGSGSSGSGSAYSEITLGTGLSMSGTTLSASGSYTPIATGTSNPGSPATNDLFFRTDLKLLIFYDGTFWLTMDEYQFTSEIYNASGNSDSTIYQGTDATHQTYITTIDTARLVTASNTGAAGWEGRIVYGIAAGTETQIATLSTRTAPDANNTWITEKLTVNATIPTTAKVIYAKGIKTSTPGNFFYKVRVKYRLVIT